MNNKIIPQTQEVKETKCARMVHFLSKTFKDTEFKFDARNPESRINIKTTMCIGGYEFAWNISLNNSYKPSFHVKQIK